MKALDYQTALNVEALLDAVLDGDLDYRIPRCGETIRVAISAGLLRRNASGDLAIARPRPFEILRAMHKEPAQ